MYFSLLLYICTYCFSFPFYRIFQKTKWVSFECNPIQGNNIVNNICQVWLVITLSFLCPETKYLLVRNVVWLQHEAMNRFNSLDTQYNMLKVSVTVVYRRFHMSLLLDEPLPELKSSLKVTLLWQVTVCRQKQMDSLFVKLSHYPRKKRKPSSNIVNFKTKFFSVNWFFFPGTGPKLVHCRFHRNVGQQYKLIVSLLQQSNLSIGNYSKQSGIYNYCSFHWLFFACLFFLIGLLNSFILILCSPLFSLSLVLRF